MSTEKLKFRQAVHSDTGEPIVEVWSADAKELLGVLYPTSNGVKLVSKYITYRRNPHLIVVDPAEPPAIIITLAGA